MKVGDLVKYKNLHGHVVDGKFISKSWVGIIVEIGKYTGNSDVKVSWNNAICTECSDSLEVINESR
jgi:hypothetical protein